MEDKSSVQSVRQKGDPERHFQIFCDESGIHEGQVFGFGSLWMTWERRGDFAQIWDRLRSSHFINGEAKWSKVGTATLPFYRALVDEFFEREWLMFHCIVCSRDDVNLELHDGDWDLARRKLLTLLLSNKLKRFARPGKVYRIRVDPLPSRYAKAEEACEMILKNVLAQSGKLSKDVVHSVLPVESKATPALQMCDVLLGAVVAARRGEITAQGKLDLVSYIADKLRWQDLAHDTPPATTKLNIWRFWDPQSGRPRAEKTEWPK